MTPVYDTGGITLYHGDAREIVPMLGRVATVITDPVWPNVPAGLLAGSDDPAGLFADVAAHFPAIADRAVIHLGCNSDPRFLTGLPASMPFFRVHWMEYASPHYLGRLLYTSDVAYVFGEPPPSRPGGRVIPGKTVATGRTSARGRVNHPCPRSLEHCRYLVRWYGCGAILDPFAGSGTTLLAAAEQGIPAIGIEYEEEYIETIINRLTAKPLLIT